MVVLVILHWSWMKLLVSALGLLYQVPQTMVLHLAAHLEVPFSALVFWALLLPSMMLWTLQTMELQLVYWVVVHQQGLGFP